MQMHPDFVALCSSALSLVQHGEEVGLESLDSLEIDGLDLSVAQCRANHKNPPGGYLNLLLNVVNLFLTCACPEARGAMAQVSLVRPLAQRHWISPWNRGSTSEYGRGTTESRESRQW